MKYTKSILDKRIRDVEGGANTQTYREYIRDSEEEFGLEKMDLDNMLDKNLTEYIDFLDYLWTK